MRNSTLLTPCNSDTVARLRSSWLQRPAGRDVLIFEHRRQAAAAVATRIHRQPVGGVPLPPGAQAEAVDVERLAAVGGDREGGILPVVQLRVIAVGVVVTGGRPQPSATARRREHVPAPTSRNSPRSHCSRHPRYRWTPTDLRPGGPAPDKGTPLRLRLRRFPARAGWAWPEPNLAQRVGAPSSSSTKLTVPSPARSSLIKSVTSNAISLPTSALVIVHSPADSPFAGRLFQVIALSLQLSLLSA